MPVNIGFTFLFGGILGWIVVKILKPKPYLEGLIIAASSAGLFFFFSTSLFVYWVCLFICFGNMGLGNLGNLLLIIIPAICNEDGSPFGNGDTCTSLGLSYASFSMAVCNLTYS